jgi:tetratricopeptide (TPR) repeat protein
MAAAFCFLRHGREGLKNRSRIVRTRVSKCVVMAMLASVGAVAQVSEWQRTMDEGAKAELTGEYVQAAASYEKATRASAALAQSDARRVFAWNAVANMYDALGRLADAERAYRRGLKEAEAARGVASPEYSLLLENLSTLYLEMGQTPRAEKLARQAYNFYRSAAPREEFRLAMAENCLGEILTSRGKYRDSETLLSDAAGILEKQPKNATELGIVMNNLAVVRFFLKDYAETQRMLLRALDLIEQRMGPDHPMLIRTLNNLAALAKREGRLDECGAHLRRAMSIAEKYLGTDHPIYAAVLASYADYLRRQGDKSEAKVMMARSVQILKDSDRRNGIGAVVDIKALQGK